MTASASMPPTPQPSTPRPLIIVVWLSVPTRRVGQGHAALGVVRRKDALGQILQIHLVDDSDGGRHDAEIGERLLAPAEELVALAIALEFQADVLHPGRPATPKQSTCTE